MNSTTILGGKRYRGASSFAFPQKACSRKQIVTLVEQVCGHFACSDKLVQDSAGSSSRTVRGRRGVPGVRRAWRRQIEPQNHSVVGLP